MSLRGLMVVALVVGGCSATPTTQYTCSPACPTGSHCMASGCVSDSGPADLAAPDMRVSMGGCQPPCGGSTPVCNAEGTCVACAVDGDCPTGQVCALLGGTAAVSHWPQLCGSLSVSAQAPPQDFRSIFTLGGNDPTVYARGFGSSEVQVMKNPGVFGNSLALGGAAPDAQSAVVFDDSGGEVIAMSGGTVTRWDSATGAFIANVVLIGYGKNGENMYPQNRGIAKVHGYYLTYFNTTLTAWDEMGNQAKTTTLNGAGTSFDSYFGYSWANGMFFVVDASGATWRGYDVGL